LANTESTARRTGTDRWIKMEPTIESRERRNRLSILTGIVMGLVAVIFVIVPTFLYIFTPHFHGTVFDNAALVDDFSLPRADGGTFRLSSYKGQVVILFFGYTTCPDECPATLVELNQMTRQLGERAKDVTVVFITVDPRTDSADRMKAYLVAFNPNFIGLVGTVNQLQPVYDEFGINILRADQGQAAASTGIGHTTSLYVIDQQGRMRVQLHEGETAQGIANDVQNLLNEAKPAS
jgi:protein SCO1/2